MFTKTFFEKGNNAKCFFRGYGSFGEIKGEVVRDGNTILNKTADYKIQSKYEVDEYGVCTRNDLFTNTSDRDIEVNCLKSRFIFDGGEYQVYTQFCNWQAESKGIWQPLSTSVSVSGASIRTVQDGAPFLALWSEQENRGFVEDCPKNHFAAASCCITKTGRDRSPALEKYALLQMLRLIVSEDPSTLLGMTGEHSSPLQSHPERS